MAEGDIKIDKGKVSNEQMGEIKTGEYITPKELAERLRYSYSWVLWLLQESRIKGIKPLGGRWRIPSSEYDRILKEGVPPLPKEGKRPPVIEIKVDDKMVKKISEKEEKGQKEPPFKFPLDFNGLFGGGKKQ